MTTPWWWDDVEENEDIELESADLDEWRKIVLEREREVQKRRKAGETIESAYGTLIERAALAQEGGVGTGWPSIDRGLGQPILEGEVVLLAARTGVGKTWSIQQICEHITKNRNHRVVVASLEMSIFQLAQRLAAHAEQIPPDEVLVKARAGELSVPDLLSKTPGHERWYLYEKGLTVEGLGDLIQSAADHFTAAPTVLAVDYMGLLGWSGGRASIYERASENARALKEIAKDHRIIILAAAQLSRAAGSGEDEPSLDAMRDSGAIEEAADRALLFWRVADSGDEVMVKIGKNRFGGTGFKTRLKYLPSMRLVEMTNEDIFAVENVNAKSDLPY